MAVGIEDVAKAGEHIDRQLAEVDKATKRAHISLKKIVEVVPPDNEAVGSIRGLLSVVEGLCGDFRTFKELLFEGMQQLANNQKQEVEKLNAELSRQQTINKNMKREVLELNELITDHIQMSRKKIEERDQQIVRLKICCSVPSSAIPISLEEEKFTESELMHRTSLDTIKEEEEINNSNIKTNDRREETQQQPISDLRMDSSSVRNSRHESVDVSVSAIRIDASPSDKEHQLKVARTEESSERRSSSKTKVRFFIDDFRKASEAAEDGVIVGQPVPCQKRRISSFTRGDGAHTSNLLPVYHEVIAINQPSLHNSATISGSSSHSHLSIAQNENDGLWAPYKDISPKKQDFTRNKRKPAKRLSDATTYIETKPVSSLQSMESCAVNLVEYSSSNLPRNRSGRKEKIQLTQKDHNDGHVSPNFLRAGSRDKLKQVDTNSSSNKSLNSRPNSKEKLSLTVKSTADSAMSNSQTGNRPRKFPPQQSQLPVAIQHLPRLDLQVGNSNDSVRYEGARRNGMRSGKGRLEFIGGMVFEGDFKDNVRHGYGVLLVNSKEVYAGEWQRDKMCGQGTIKHMHLIHRPDKLNDSGFLAFLRQTWYTGEFEQNKFHGTGTLHTGVDKITGKFHDGLPERENTFYRRTDEDFNRPLVQLPRRIGACRR